MTPMTREEILHLGSLARIRMSDEEADTHNEEVSAILQYVSAIDAVVDSAALEKKVGAVHNVFREDIATNQPEQYTKSLLAAMPEKSGRHMRVEKILHTEDT